MAKSNVKKILTSLNLRSDLYQYVVEQSQKDMRSMNNMIEVIIEAHKKENEK